MERVASKEEARQASEAARRESKRIALVPTMGALHEGHLSLVRAACQRADYTAVSIFVNPTQFGEGEDFDAYPRDVDADIAALKAEGVDLVFTPNPNVMYGRAPQVSVDPGPLGHVWEGASRPGHFGGVCTIVTKLFNIFRPHVAFFGEKDYQQLAIIRALAEDLDVATTIVGMEIVRERDGLAMSSRNAYLNDEEREQALALSRALDAAAQAVAWGERGLEQIERAMVDLLNGYPLVSTEYARIVDSRTLEAPDGGRLPDHGGRAIVAARLGATRLIDNASLCPPLLDSQ